MTYWSKEFEEACAKADATADNHSSEQKSAEDCAAAQKGQPLSIADFLTKELPERKNIIDPWLPEKGLGMIYSPAGSVRRCSDWGAATQSRRPKHFSASRSRLRRRFSMSTARCRRA